jgi:phosphoserine phosphatase RsbU/P
MSRVGVATAHAPRLVFRYIVLSALFTMSVLFQIGSIRNIVHNVPAIVPKFVPGEGTAALRFVDSKASAAGLRRGDILVAINGRPYTGQLVWYEAINKARPGDLLAVTVRSPGAGSQDRTVNLLVGQGTRWSSAQILFTVVFMPAFCLALGFWVVAVRPDDPLAWLLLGLMMSFAQLLSAESGLEGWGAGLTKITAAYSELLGAAWPAFMFLFGFYFPEPLPFFRRPGSWWRWLPAFAIAPYVVLGLVDSGASVGELTNISVASLSRILPLLRAVFEIYIFCLVGAFFAFISTKSSMALSFDSKRRLRLLYWGTTIALTPALLFGVAIWLTDLHRLPDWLGSIVGLMLLIFPLTLAYVIVVQKPWMSGLFSAKVFSTRWRKMGYAPCKCLQSCL